MSRPTNAAICSFVNRVRGCLYKKTSRSRSQPFRMTERRASSCFTSSWCWRLFDGVGMSCSPSRSVKETRFSSKRHRDRDSAASEPYEVRVYTLVGHEDRVFVGTSGTRIEKQSGFRQKWFQGSRILPKAERAGRIRRLHLQDAGHREKRERHHP